MANGKIQQEKWKNIDVYMEANMNRQEGESKQDVSLAFWQKGRVSVTGTRKNVDPCRVYGDCLCQYKNNLDSKTLMTELKN